MGNAPIINVTGLTKQYADVLAVAGLDFQVDGGTVLGLVGPNGAGKTTSMRCMTGIIPATAGRMCIAGNLAIPFSPSDLPVGPVYRFSVWHTMRLEDPLEVFPIKLGNV